MAEPLKVVVAEDEPYNRKRLSRLLREAGCEVVAELPDGPAVLEWLEAGGQAQAIFLDIEMPGASGLEVALDLPGDLGVVFVTAHPDHAVKAWETPAVDFLLKPATAERLATSLARVREKLQRPEGPGRNPHPRRYPLKAGSGLVMADFQRTSHFEVEDEVVWAWLAGERHRTTWKRLTEVEGYFPEGELLRGHRHLLIRPGAVVGLRNGAFGRLWVRLAGGQEVEVSRGAAPALKAGLGLG